MKKRDRSRAFIFVQSGSKPACVQGQRKDGDGDEVADVTEAVADVVVQVVQQVIEAVHAVPHHRENHAGKDEIDEFVGNEAVDALVERLRAAEPAEGQGDGQHDDNRRECQCGDSAAEDRKSVV